MKEKNHDYLNRFQKIKIKKLQLNKKYFKNFKYLDTKNIQIPIAFPSNKQKDIKKCHAQQKPKTI